MYNRRKILSIVRHKILTGENIDSNSYIFFLSKFSVRDDDKMNTLVFINFLLVKLFPTLIRQNFLLSKICAIQYLISRIHYSLNLTINYVLTFICIHYITIHPLEKVEERHIQYIFDYPNIQTVMAID